MKQKYLKNQEEQKKKDFPQEFNAIKEKKIEEATTKIVNIKILTGCGCGGSYDKYHVEVPIDSKVQNGQYFRDIEDWMENIEEGWVW